LPVRREIMKENKIKEILAQPVMLWGGRNKQVLSQGSIDMLTKQIVDLSIKTQAEICESCKDYFEFKRLHKLLEPPEEVLLSPEEISQHIQQDCKLWCPTKGEFLQEVGEVISKAQAQKCQAYYEAKGDEEGLLTDEDIIRSSQWYEEKCSKLDVDPDFFGEMKAIADAQKALGSKKIKELEEQNAEYQEDCVELARQLVEVDEKHQKETEGIFEEIEAMFEPTVPMTMKYEDWRALKKKLGGKDG